MIYKYFKKKVFFMYIQLDSNLLNPKTVDFMSVTFLLVGFSMITVPHYGSTCKVQSRLVWVWGFFFHEAVMWLIISADTDNTTV